MRHYETIYIIDPNRSDEDHREIKEKFITTIENSKGVVIKSRDWGKQRIQKVQLRLLRPYRILRRSRGNCRN